jgi:surfeit locus 1 family protein
MPFNDSDSVPARKLIGRWFLLLVTALAMAATAALGIWQLQRAATKESIAVQMENKKKLAAIENAMQLSIGVRVSSSTSINGHIAPSGLAGDTHIQALVHRRVDLRGTWLHQYTVFLDNRFMAGRAGFVVATPLQLADSPYAVWVQRGWVMRDPRERTRLPVLAAPLDQAKVQGTLMAQIPKVYALGTTASASTAVVAVSALEATRDSRIWQNLPALDFPASVQLLPIAVLQTAAELGDAQDGLLRDWAAQDAGIAKHYGYAFQWFALCGLIMVLYAWFQFIAPRRLKG